jgi:excinuclease UvrABC nuclease subunit
MRNGKSEKSKLDKIMAIDKIVEMRLKDMASTRTCLEYLKSQFGYEQSQAYTIMSEAHQKIKEMSEKSNQQNLETAKNQLEQMAEDATKNKQYKLAFEIRKELNNLEGLNKANDINFTGNINISFGDKNLGDVTSEEE